MLKFWTAKK